MLHFKQAHAPCFGELGNASDPFGRTKQELAGVLRLGPMRPIHALGPVGGNSCEARLEPCVLFGKKLRRLRSEGFDLPRIRNRRENWPSEGDLAGRRMPIPDPIDGIE